MACSFSFRWFGRHAKVFQNFISQFFNLSDGIFPVWKAVGSDAELHSPGERFSVAQDRSHGWKFFICHQQGESGLVILEMKASGVGENADWKWPPRFLVYATGHLFGSNEG